MLNLLLKRDEMPRSFGPHTTACACIQSVMDGTTAPGTYVTISPLGPSEGVARILVRFGSIFQSVFCGIEEGFGNDIETIVLSDQLAF